MKKTWLSFLLLLPLSLTGCTTGPSSTTPASDSTLISSTSSSSANEDPGDVNNSYSNPVKFYREDGTTEFVGVADPFCLRADNGLYYLYCTQLDCTRGEYGYGLDYSPIFESANLTEWHWVGSAFIGHEEYAEWNNHEKGVWAPTVCKIGDTYNLYYTLGAGGYYSDYTGIGVCTSPTPYGPWTHYGKLFDSGEIGVRNSIDPFVFVEDGHVYMTWGSGDGIWICELDETGTALKGGLEAQKEAKRQIAAYNIFENSNYEASFIQKHDGYYYLYLSTGSCCDGIRSTYKTVVGRSESLYGPYVGSNGRPIDTANRGDTVVQPHKRFGMGTGHCAVVQDDKGYDWLIYHSYCPFAETEVQKNTRTLYIDRLYWNEKGYPEVQDTYPSNGTVPGPYILA